MWRMSVSALRVMVGRYRYMVGVGVATPMLMCVAGYVMDMCVCGILRTQSDRQKKN